MGGHSSNPSLNKNNEVADSSQTELMNSINFEEGARRKIARCGRGWYNPALRGIRYVLESWKRKKRKSSRAFSNKIYRDSKISPARLASRFGSVVSVWCNSICRNCLDTGMVVSVVSNIIIFLVMKYIHILYTWNITVFFLIGRKTIYLRNYNLYSIEIIYLYYWFYWDFIWISNCNYAVIGLIRLVSIIIWS